MDVRACPGKNLSLSQLVFTLSEELKHAGYSLSYVVRDRWTRSQGFEERCADFPYSFTFDSVFQLDQNFSIVLANVREHSFV